MGKFKSLDRLPSEVVKTYKPFAEKLLDLYPQGIVSIALYGSATGNNYVPKMSDINSLVVFNQIEFDDLKKSLKLVSDGHRQRISTPLFLTQAYIVYSLDIFPLEFFDMKDNHLTIYGHNLLSTLDISADNLRLFCEQQIKGRLVRIRQAYLEVGRKREGMEALLKESLASLYPTFRGLIRLKGVQPPSDKERIISELCALFDINARVLTPVCRHQQGAELLPKKDVETFFKRYLEEMERLAVAADEL